MDDPGNVKHILATLRQPTGEAKGGYSPDGDAAAVVAALEEKHGVDDALRLLKVATSCMATEADLDGPNGKGSAVEGCNDWAVGELRTHFLVSQRREPRHTTPHHAAPHYRQFLHR